jgi:steroid 5-alpha reductase family enzyme
MTMPSRLAVTSLVGTTIAVAIGAGVAVAGSSGGSSIGAAAGPLASLPVFALCVGLAFVAQWLAFVPAYLGRTERFYDLTGSLTYVSVTVIAVVLGPAPDARSLLLLGLIVVWAARLGWFLVSRIRAAGHDDRFETIKASGPRFLLAWTLQGLWVALTLAAALAAITTRVRAPLDAPAIIGLLVWLAGFAVEALADDQKRRFRADPANRGRFIRSGLWAWSRHPNYFGEIVLWSGIAIIALPVLAGWQLVTLVSPVFVAFLLTRVSGIPLLERKADATWGGQPDYEAYKAATSVLVPRPPRTA